MTVCDPRLHVASRELYVNMYQKTQSVLITWVAQVLLAQVQDLGHQQGVGLLPGKYVGEIGGGGGWRGRWQVTVAGARTTSTYGRQAGQIRSWDVESWPPRDWEAVACALHGERGKHSFSLARDEIVRRTKDVTTSSTLRWHGLCIWRDYAQVLCAGLV